MSKAVELIYSNFQHNFDSGNFDSIWRWFEKIDNDSISKDSKLLYYKALMLRYYKGDMDGSIPFIDKAIKLEKDNEFLIRYYTSKSRNLISLGRINEAIKHLTDVLSKKTSSENKIPGAGKPCCNVASKARATAQKP